MEKFLNRWFEKGLISKEQYLDLLNDLKSEKTKSAKLKSQIALYLIGAVLVGLGVFLFISANDWILELLNKLYFIKIFIVLLLSILSLYFGNKLQNQSNYPKLGSSLIFLSTLLTGGTIALVGQAYNFKANSSWLYYLWFLSVYPLAFLFRSQAINILSIVIFIIATSLFYERWSGKYYDIFITLGGLLYTMGGIKKIRTNYENFALVYKSLGLLSIFIFFFVLTFTGGYLTDWTNWYERCAKFYNDGFYFETACFDVIVPCVLIGILNIINYIRNKEKSGLAKTEFIFLLSSFAYAILSYSFPFWWGYVAHLFIIAMIYLEYHYGIKLEKDNFVRIARVMLWFYIAYLYIRFGVDYHLGALYFTLGGVILISLGIYKERNKKPLKETKESSQKIEG